MPSTFLRITPLGRSAHPSLVALAAYRAGETLHDTRQGRTYDHSDRHDVLHRELLQPSRLRDNTWATDRATVWNRVQERDPGARASLAREILVVLPDELTSDARMALARDYARTVTEKTGALVDLTVHAPRELGDERNHHAHLLLSARRLTADGFGERIALAQRWPELKAAGLPAVPKQIEEMKALWIEHGNAALATAGLEARLSDRRVDELGIRIPTKPGWSRAVEERLRNGEESVVIERELRRYDYELTRQALALKSLENERLAERLRREKTQEAGAPAARPSGSKLVPVGETIAAMPTDFEGWKAWRARQTFDAGDTERRAIEEWRRQRARVVSPASPEAGKPRTPSPATRLAAREPLHPEDRQHRVVNPAEVAADDVLMPP